jgi:hypothetical protein
MGKSRPKKHKKRLPNPTGIPSQKELEEAEEEMVGENEPIPMAALAEKVGNQVFDIYIYLGRI